MSSPTTSESRSQSVEGDVSPWMDRALTLATRGLGFVSPNPPVGAILVSPSGEVLGEGWHGRYGGPHAEVWALRDAIDRGHESHIERATLVVTLEPCNHHGRTPPCVDAILEARVPRVVVATEDPNPSVAGEGLARLQTEGVEVVTGVREAAARRLVEAFARHVTTGMPLVTMKVAQTLDGRVASRSGDSRWVSGPAARSLVHRLRAESDAVLVGAGTARTDDPALTVRHRWEGRPDPDPRQPQRIVLDRTGSLPPHLTLFTDEHAAATVAVTAPDARPGYSGELERRGGAVMRIPTVEGHLDLRTLLSELGRGSPGRRPVQSLLVEAGPGLATALLRQNLVDRLLAFVAPKILGAGRATVGDLGNDRMAEALQFHEHRWELIGEDALLRGYLRPV